MPKKRQQSYARRYGPLQATRSHETKRSVPRDRAIGHVDRIELPSRRRAHRNLAQPERGIRNVRAIRDIGPRKAHVRERLQRRSQVRLVTSRRLIASNGKR